MVREVEDPLDGTMLHPGVVPCIDGQSPPPRSTGPVIGADNEAVLTGLLGLNAARIAALRESGVV
jgi:crotonobetainyl-CoA:carnitine CoA-transferase CaiB-like acyl-CoA transferase